jgi:hypothetical protein
MNTYELCTETDYSERFEAANAEDAAETALAIMGTAEFDLSRTVHYHGTLYEIVVDEDGDEKAERIYNLTYTFDAKEPECTDDEHDWQAPYSVLGGIRENPGVWGHGGGVIIREVCAHCGAYRETDTWAQDPSTGAQGLRSVRYEPADDASLAWIAAGSTAE